MNVFDFLGAASPRKPEKTVQKVKNIEEVPDSKKKWPMYAQVKKDGVYTLMAVQGIQCEFFGRTGKALSNMEHLGLPSLPDGVYVGEVCFPGYSLEVLSGIVNPNRTKPVDEELFLDWLNHAEVHWHDFLSIEEFLAGESRELYSNRHRYLHSLGLRTLPLHIVGDADSAEQFAEAYIEGGEEGVVFKQDTGWEAGHKGWRMMKRVRRIEYDLLCIDVEEGMGKYAGKAANLLFQWKGGKTLKAMLGKNYSHEDAKEMWECYLNGGDKCPVLSIFTVYGLQDSSKGKIRLPKVGELRHDKETPDF